MEGELLVAAIIQVHLVARHKAVAPLVQPDGGVPGGHGGRNTCGGARCGGDGLQLVGVMAGAGAGGDGLQLVGVMAGAGAGAGVAGGGGRDGGFHNIPRRVSRQDSLRGFFSFISASCFGQLIKNSK